MVHPMIGNPGDKENAARHFFPGNISKLKKTLSDQLEKLSENTETFRFSPIPEPKDSKSKTSKTQ